MKRASLSESEREAANAARRSKDKGNREECRCKKVKSMPSSNEDVIWDDDDEEFFAAVEEPSHPTAATPRRPLPESGAFKSPYYKCLA